MSRKTVEQFIEENRAELTRLIYGAIYRYDGNGGRGTVPGSPPALDDEDLEQWIANDEGLYLWARSEGVRDEEEDTEPDESEDTELDAIRSRLHENWGDNLYLCSDCTMVACNRSRGADIEPEQLQRTETDLRALAHVVPNFDSETGEGLETFL